jgi:hypothetical protein
MRLSLEAVIGFASRQAGSSPGATTTPESPKSPEISENDRRFLRSLRIAVDETAEEVE